MTYRLLGVLTLSSLLISLSSCTTQKRSDEPIDKNKIFSLAPQRPFENGTIDGVLVTIANQSILLSDLQQAIIITTSGQTHINQNGLLIGGSMTVVQAEQVFDTLINQKVLQIKSNELGMDIEEDELSKRIDEFLKQRGFSQKDLEQQLAQTGKSLASYREEFKNEILKQQLIGRTISPYINVSDDEVRNFYIQSSGNTQQISSVKLRSLVLNIPENEKNNPQNWKLLKELHEKINSGENFVNLVKSYSMASDAQKTEGILPPRPISQLPQQLKDKLTKLEINQIIGPIFIANSIFYFQYLGTEFNNNNDFDKNFQTLKAKLPDLKFNERLSEYLKSERAKLKTNIRPFKIHR